MKEETRMFKSDSNFGISSNLRDVARAILEKKHTTPTTDKEKKLAALAEPKDKITKKDVLVGRGVIAKEEVEELDEKKKDYEPSDAVKANNPLVFGDKKKNNPLVFRDKHRDNPLVFGKKKVKEEVEELDEISSKLARKAEGKSITKMNKAIDKGDYETELKRRAQNDYFTSYAAKKEKAAKMAKEEVEQIDEISKKTAMSAYQSASFIDSEHPK